eukprot:CAMPEP_0185744998 /NCGR_PEP_ID=MMETSP1174-20130828/3285_1 /TAXON_ID=35687 /ORGANISM="Dictyocha speculum, Strain CCMP1381" /LENGTH=350 /DNA_ID=CAMNT_0028418763 /DNA_START=20 /DNA_END=1069 /DNA_ORIENTATION=+
MGSTNKFMYRLSNGYWNVSRGLWAVQRGYARYKTTAAAASLDQIQGWIDCRSTKGSPPLNGMQVEVPRVNKKNKKLKKDPVAFTVVDESAKTSPTKQKKKLAPLCRYFRKGKCRFGDRCKFRHRTVTGLDDYGEPVYDDEDEEYEDEEEEGYYEDERGASQQQQSGAEDAARGDTTESEQGDDDHQSEDVEQSAEIMRVLQQVGLERIFPKLQELGVEDLEELLILNQDEYENLMQVSVAERTKLCKAVDALLTNAVEERMNENHALLSQAQQSRPAPTGEEGVTAVASVAPEEIFHKGEWGSEDEIDAGDAVEGADDFEGNDAEEPVVAEKEAEESVVAEKEAEEPVVA